MNASKVLTEVITELAESLSREMKAIAAILPRVGHLEFSSERTHIRCSGRTAYFTVYTREDLQVAMSLLPGVWKKENYYDEGIEYSNWEGKEGGTEAWNSDFKVEVVAKEAALPVTCQVVEETVTQPAQEARTYKRKRLQCITGVEQADSAVADEVKI